MRAFPLSACLLLWTVTLHAQDTSAHKSAALSWGPAPAVFPKGAKMAVVSGNPAEAAEFTVQLAMPDGYRIAPHFHPTDETVEVKKGTFLVGMGDTLDIAKTKAMKVGAAGTIPALGHHYAVARGATVVSVTAMGPFAMTYVNPAEDPQESAHP
ncbi:MAG: cupin domain-containing protein [Gemmatimonadales bacterium]